MQVQFTSTPRRHQFQVLASKSSQSIPEENLGKIVFSEVPDFTGAPEGIRTPDPQIRSFVRLYFPNPCPVDILRPNPKQVLETPLFSLAVLGRAVLAPGHAVLFAVLT